MSAEHSPTNDLINTFGRIGMMASGPMLLISMIIRPGEHRDAARELAMVEASSGRWITSHILLGLALVALIPALLALALRVVSRSAGMASLGLLLGWTGCGAWFASVGLELSASSATHAGTGPAVAVYDHVLNSAPTLVPAFALSICLSIGLGALAIMTVTRKPSTWFPATFVVTGAGCLAAGGPAASRTAWLIGAMLITIGFLSYEINDRAIGGSHNG